MRFTDLFIKRPVLATSLSLLLLILGLNALYGLPIRQYPQLKTTVITVTTPYVGAAQDVVQGFVTQPIQQALASVEGVDYITSSSKLGVSVVTVRMRINVDGKAALAEAIGKIQSVKSQLPRGIDDPVITKTTGETTATMYLWFNSETLSAPQITDYLVRVVQPKLASVPGVADPQIIAGQPFAMRIWLDPQRLAGFGLTAIDVRAAIAANNYQTAAGQIRGYLNQFDVEVETLLNDPKKYEQMIVAARPEGVVRLGDVAEVSLGAKSVDIAAYAAGNPSVFFGIYPTPDANPLDVARGVKAIMPDIERDLPAGMKGGIAYDSTMFIDRSIAEVRTTLVEAVIIVVIVITLFLGSLRAVLIPVVTIPLSLIGVCIFLAGLGFSINLLTLLAAVLAIGLVVDDAIVVVENVDRHLNMGKSPLQAALIGTREIATPVISMTITLAAVYAPIALTGGVTGTLFREFALALAGSVVVSGFIALTLSPMMTGKVLRHVSKPGLFQRFTNWWLGGLERAYAWLLYGALRARFVMLLLAGGTFYLIWLMFGMIRTELAPGEDQGVVFAVSTAPADAHPDYIRHYALQVNKLLEAVPETYATFLLTGVPASNGAFGGAVLKPWEARARGHNQIIGELWGKGYGVLGLRVAFFGPAPLPGSGSGLPVQFAVTTTADYRTLAGVMEKLVGAAWGSGLFAFVDNDLKFENPSVKVAIDRDKAGAYGVTMEAIGATLSTLMSGAYVNRMAYDGRSYEVIPQVPRTGRLTPDALGQYYVRARDGAAVPLSNLVRIETQVLPIALGQLNQLNAAVLSAALAPGVTQGQAVAFLNAKAQDLLPAGFKTDTQGETRQFVQEGSSLYITFALALAIIFLVLAMQFESFRDPLVIMVSVPLSICGGLVPLALGWTTMNIYSQVGLITLIGLITKHGILICEVARERQEHFGDSRVEAVRHAAVQRLRPILMTTGAMVAGLTPLLLASGAGAASRYAIGIVIVMGLSVGTVFTLFVLPAIYSFLASKRASLAPAAVGHGTEAAEI